MTKQVMDFVRRLKTSISTRPTGYHPCIISDYIKSNFRKAIAFDHHVNRPGYVASDFGYALKVFHNQYPTMPNNPGHWAANHAPHELALLEFYGPSRRMTDAALRYQSLKNNL
jgi:hypothetical protein